LIVSDPLQILQEGKMILRERVRRKVFEEIKILDTVS